MDMDNDDQPVGRLLSRREALAVLSVMGTAALAACAPRATSTTQPTGAASATSQPTAGEATAAVAATATPQLNQEAATSVAIATAIDATAIPTTAATEVAATAGAAEDAALPACVASPELTEGPYFVDEKLNRSDIRSDPSNGSVREGIPLVLAMRVSQIGNTCAPLEGAVVDIWHCDALGVYSDATDRGFSTVGQKFLRGYQVTGANGVATFTTIYPGWYQGRAVHIHFKVRGTAASGQTYEFTSQLFFDEGVSDKVYAQQPYAEKGLDYLRNDSDGIFRQGGEQLILALNESGQGYAGTFDIGLQMA